MIHVREKPPLRTSTRIQTPSGRRYRWAADEPRPENTPSGSRRSSTMPGGFETKDVTLPRKPGVDYRDLARLSTIRDYSASGEIIGEYRLERAPAVSGDQMAISPSAVGWQANLDDNQAAQIIYIDQSQARWGPQAADRRVDRIAAGYGPQDPTPLPGDPPVLETGFSGPWSAGSLGMCEAVYDAGSGNRIGRLLAHWARNPSIGAADAHWTWDAILSIDSNLGDFDTSGNLQGAGPSDVDLTATTTDRRHAFLRLFYDTAGGDENQLYAINWSKIAVIGPHGLTLRPAEDGADYGLLASDVVRDIIGRFCPLLTVTSDSITATTLAIAQLAFSDATPPSEMVKQATRFELPDWAVWENRVFWMHPPGARGRTWRARIAPAELEETGPQVDRLWESVVVQYSDVDGSTRTVGPPGSSADTETSDLKDYDPDNPANQLGSPRRARLVMNTGTAASATAVGRAFLTEQKQLDSSGRARFVGHVEDDRGVLHPYTHVRAGDRVIFVDARDPSPRRIIRADQDDASRTCSIDIDAPPEGLQALLERLDVALVPLGVSS